MVLDQPMFPTMPTLYTRDLPHPRFEPDHNEHRTRNRRACRLSRSSPAGNPIRAGYSSCSSGRLHTRLCDGERQPAKSSCRSISDSSHLVVHFNAFYCPFSAFDTDSDANRRVCQKPNLTPPVTTTAQALEYRDRLKGIDPSIHYVMTLYLSPDLTPHEIHKAKRAGIVGSSQVYVDYRVEVTSTLKIALFFRCQVVSARRNDKFGRWY